MLSDRTGSGVPKFKSTPPPSLPLSPLVSPSSYFSLPPGFSLAELLDSPVLLNSSNVSLTKFQIKLVPIHSLLSLLFLVELFFDPHKIILQQRKSEMIQNIETEDFSFVKEIRLAKLTRDFLVDLKFFIGLVKMLNK